VTVSGVAHFDQTCRFREDCAFATMSVAADQFHAYSIAVGSLRRSPPPEPMSGAAM
jgi:hypothetical protein